MPDMSRPGIWAIFWMRFCPARWCAGRAQRWASADRDLGRAGSRFAERGRGCAGRNCWKVSWPAPAEPGPAGSAGLMRKAAWPALARCSRISARSQAHGFFAPSPHPAPMLSLAAPARRERAPAVPARWLTRLNALLEGSGLALCRWHDASSWAGQLSICRLRASAEAEAAARARAVRSVCAPKNAQHFRHRHADGRPLYDLC